MVSSRNEMLTFIVTAMFITSHVIQVDPSSKLSSLMVNETQYSNSIDHLRLIKASISRFAGTQLVVCVVVREPFVIYTEPDKGTGSREELKKAMENLDNYSGVAIEVTKRLAQIFKLKVRVVRPADGQFGVLDARNGWTGLMGSIVRNESQLGVTALSITSSRAEAVDFTRAYYVETSALLLRIPEEVQDFAVIIEPFSPIVWCLLSVTIIFLIFVIMLMTKLEDNERVKHQMMKAMRQRNHKHHSRLRSLSSEDKLARVASLHAPHPNPRKRAMANRYGSSSKSLSLSSLLNNDYQLDMNDEIELEKSEFGSNWTERFYYSVTCVLNILLNKDIKHPPRQTPIRILVCVWWLATIVIVNFYLGTLFEQLVLPRRSKIIDNLEELVGQDKISWGVTRGSAMQELFLHAKEKSIYWQIGQRMQNVSSADEGVRRVVESNFAFIRERSILTFKIAQAHRKMGACKMQLAKEEFLTVGFGLAVPKNSAYLKPFDAAITLMIENGFVARWQSEYWPQKSRFTECQQISANQAEPLSVKHFISIFLVLLLFVGLGLLILVYQHGKEASIRMLEQTNTSGEPA